MASDGVASALAEVLFNVAEKAFDGAGKMFDETVDLFADRLVPQGCAELAAGLFSQSDGYVPYGTGQQPLEVERPQENVIAEREEPKGNPYYVESPERDGHEM